MYSDNFILLRVEPVQLSGGVVPFIHCEVLEYSRKVKQTVANVVSTLGCIYALADTPKLSKFASLVGGTVIKQTPVGNVLRFN